MWKRRRETWHNNRFIRQGSRVQLYRRHYFGSRQDWYVSEVSLRFRTDYPKVVGFIFHSSVVFANIPPSTSPDLHCTERYNSGAPFTQGGNGHAHQTTDVATANSHRQRRASLNQRTQSELNIQYTSNLDPNFST